MNAARSDSDNRNARRIARLGLLPAALLFLFSLAAGSSCCQLTPPEAHSSAVVADAACEDNVNYCEMEADVGEQYASVLAAPARAMSTAELRAIVPDLLALSELGPRTLLGQTRAKAIIPDDFPPRYGPITGPEMESMGCDLVTLRTAIGPIRFLEIASPVAASTPPDKLVVFQHGHGDAVIDWRAFAPLFRELLAQNVVVILPIQPATDFCNDALMSRRLLLLNRSMMGVRVALESTVIEFVKNRWNPVEVIFVGHSGGSMWGYFTSAVDDRIDAIAFDHFTGTSGAMMDVTHCETVRGLIYFADPVSGGNRMDILHARRTYVQNYGYPDRQALLDWIVAADPAPATPASER